MATEQKETKLKFKVGDQVRIVKRNDPQEGAHEFEIGEIVTIDGVYDSPSDEHYGVHSARSHWYIDWDEVEAI
jgi:hypothetical protein